MRISLPLLAIALVASSIGAANAQQRVVTTKGSAVPSGINFAYDAEKNQITSSGVQVKPAVLGQASTTPTTGKIVVTINLHIASTFGQFTNFRCSVYAIGGIIDLDNGTVNGAIETVGGNAKSTGGGNAVCTLSIPYSWTLAKDSGADSGLILAFGVAAINTNKEVQRSTLQVDGIENLPASGTTSKFAFDVVL